MRIQINTAHNLNGTSFVTEHVRTVVQNSLDLYQNRISVIEVYLSAERENEPASRDLRCLIEAHLTGLRPAAVHHDAGTLDQAVEGALIKITRTVGSMLGRRQQ